MNPRNENSRLKVACYYPWIYLRSGAERTILEQVRRSRHEWTIYTNHYDRHGTFPEFTHLNVVELPRISVDRGYVSVLRGAFRLLTQRLPLSKHDILVNHSEGIGDLILFVNHSKPTVCYCHLPLLVANDESVRTRYIQRNPRKALLLNIFARTFKTVDRLAWKNYSYVFTSGETVREMILTAGLAPEHKIAILHPGVDYQMITPSHTFENYFLAFSRLKWWKNIELAIEGFKSFMLGGSNPPFRLVVAGQIDAGSGRYYQELLARARNYSNIEFVPNPTAAQVHELYTNCYAALNTTVNEPWGIIPLEANAYGKPVIGVNRGGTKESQINGVTGLLADPTPDGFGAAMAELASDESAVRRMGLAARENVKKYGWDNHVGQLDSFLVALYGNGGLGGPYDPRNTRNTSSGR